MKKHSILFLALLAAASCQKENTQDIAPVFESNVELRASFDEQSSRIATDDGLTFSLEENNEQIGVYIQNDGMNALENVLYTAGAADEQGWISFTTQMPVQVQSTSKFFAYAPYSATTVDVSGSTEDGASEPSAAGSGWTGKRAINLPDLQEQPAAGVKTDLAKYYSVVAAPATPVARDILESYSVNLQFSGIFALVRFSLKNTTADDIKVSKIVFSAENAALTGYFSVDLTHENPKLSNTEYAPEAIAGKTFDKVTVTLAEPATIAAQETAEVYAVVNAGTFAKPKFTTYATDAAGNDIVFEKTLSDKTFSRQQRTAIGVKLENPVAADYAQEVIDALKNGGTVKIEKDVDLSSKDAFEIPAGTTVNLEVPEGITLSLAAWQITNKGEMTISGNGSITAPKGIVENFGKLTVNGINATTTVNTSGTALLNQVGAEMIINDANIDAAFYALYNDNGGTMTVNNTQITTLYCALFNNNGTMTVNSGTFKSLSDSTRGDWAYSVMARGANAVTTIGEIGGDDSEIVIAGVQGAVSADTNAKLIINSGTFATYFTQDEKELNFYALYTATGATATVNGGRFYREKNAENRTCIRIGNNDTGNTFGHMELNGGYYQDKGYTEVTKENLITPASGYIWVELETPITETVEFFGTQYTNTYYYQIVEGEDLGYKEVDGGYEIYSAKGLQWFAEEVNGGNNFSGKTVTLTADIDLDGIDWKPIGTNPDSATLRFNGVFDGNGKTISNLNVSTTVDGVPAGLFGAVSGTVKNFTIEHATINSVNVQTNRSTGVAVGVGYPSAKIENVTVKDATVNAFRQVGGIVGYLYGTVSGCTVDGLTIEAPLDSTGDNGDKVGGIAGFMGGDSGICFNNKVANANIKAYRDVGGILGIIYKGSIDTFKDNTVTDSSVEGTKGENANAGAIVGRYEGTSAAEIDSSNTATNVTVIPGGGNETIAEGIELTPDGTYNIVSAAGVKSLADLVNAGDNFEGKTIVLTADANLGGEEWMPIGNGTRKSAGYTGNAFKGTFDGNGKTISGLKISNAADNEEDGKALFGIVDGGTVKNLTLTDVSVSVSNGNVASGCVGVLINGGTVDNVTVSGSVSGSEAAAGVVSRVIKNGTVRNCHNLATVNGTKHNIGGIVGAAYYNNEGMTIEDCTNDGTISGNYAVGGIVGFSAANIKNCTNNGAIITETVSAGGIVGEQQNSGSIIGCTNNAKISNNSDGYGTGGIVGWIRYIGGASAYSKEVITVSGNTNYASIDGGNDAGGIVGTVYQYGMISDNKNYAQTLTAKTFVGGIVGNVQFIRTDGSNTSHDGMPDTFHVDIINNYSETTLDNMTGGCKGKFAYTNDSALTTISGNTPDDGVQVSTAEEAIAAIQGGGKVTVAGAIDKIDFTTLNPTAPVELVLNAKVGEIVLGSSASNPAQTTITVAKDVDYPTFSVVQGKDIQNLTIIGDPTSSKACTSGIDVRSKGITTVKNVTIKGVRFQGKGVNLTFTADPQTTQNIVIEDCEGIDMVESLFQTSNNEYVNTHVGDITIRNNKATFSTSVIDVNAIDIRFVTTGTVLIENNTFINPTKHGIMADRNACENFIVRGNTFTNPVEDGVKIDYPINNVVIENNTITPTEYGIRVARFKSDYNPTITISGNSIDMSKAKNTFNGISIAGSEANGQAKLVIKENVKVAGSVTEWLSINSALVLNEGSDVATPFNN